MKNLIRFDVKYRQQIESGNAKVFFHQKNGELLPVRIITWDWSGKDGQNCNGRIYPIIGLATYYKGLEKIIISGIDGSAVHYYYEQPVYDGEELLIQLDGK